MSERVTLEIWIGFRPFQNDVYGTMGDFIIYFFDLHIANRTRTPVKKALPRRFQEIQFTDIFGQFVSRIKNSNELLGRVGMTLYISSLLHAHQPISPKPG